MLRDWIKTRIYFYSLVLLEIKINNYLNLIIVFSKLIFVLVVCFFTIIILTILIFYDLDAKFDYILEWNYFLLLLIFYFLSFLMWKKLIPKET